MAYIKGRFEPEAYYQESSLTFRIQDNESIVFLQFL